VSEVKLAALFRTIEESRERQCGVRDTINTFYDLATLIEADYPRKCAELDALKAICREFLTEHENMMRNAMMSVEYDGRLLYLENKLREAVK